MVRTAAARVRLDGAAHFGVAAAHLETARHDADDLRHLAGLQGGRHARRQVPTVGRVQEHDIVRALCPHRIENQPFVQVRVVLAAGRRFGQVERAVVGRKLVSLPTSSITVSAWS